jgi:protein-S-isoprenylcysteine O-methyltransferase Ste14
LNVHAITGLCLILFWLYWTFSAGSVKPIKETRGWLSSNWYSILLLVGFGLKINLRFLGVLGGGVALLATPVIPVTMLVDAFSVVLAFAGLAIAIVARRTIGGNWSGAVALKEGHELVTSGPYHYVRHPIYAAVLTMALGVALSYGTLGACIGYLVIFLAILFKLRDEESLLSEHFPVDYPQYKEHTRMILPFVW